jgi:hypothetical protein
LTFLAVYFKLVNGGGKTMQDKDGILAGLKTSELWLFLATAFKHYPQFILAFIASSGFISVFVYLMRFGLNAIDIISTSDIIFNAVVNLFLLLPVYVLVAVGAAVWVRFDTAIDAAGKGQTTWLGGLFVLIRLGRIVLLLSASLVALIGAGAAILGGLNVSLPYDLGGSIEAHLGMNWQDWVGIAAGIVIIWLAPLAYERLTAGVLPRGLLTALVVFVLSNIIIGSGAHYLYAQSAQQSSLGFMRRHATNLPAQIEAACPGERDIIWTGDKALVVQCRGTGHSFIYYREYGVVVEKE